MAGVPYVFGNATTSIPLTNLDANFNTGVTIGNTTVGLGNTVTTLGNVTLTNATVSSASITDSGLTSGRVTYATTGGLLTDNAGLTFSSGTNPILTVTSAAAGSPILRSTNGTQEIRLAVAGSNQCYVGTTSNDPLAFLVNGSETMRILATGNILSLVGGSTTATGTGIAFPATQSASSDANTLDDYEEGTWTPNIGGTATYTTQKGTYVKVGRMVTCNFRITINLLLTGSTTSLYGFPFTASNDSYGDIYSGTCSFFNNLATNTSCLTNYIASNTSYVNFVGQNAFDNSCVNTPTVFGNSADLAGSVTYFV